MRQLQKKLKSGSIDVSQDDPFELFIAATNIRYCYYSETHKILGNTYGMCVLQVCDEKLCEIFIILYTLICKILGGGGWFIKEKAFFCYKI